MTASNALTLEDRFDASMGFSFAAGFMGYDGKSEPIDDPTIGEVVFKNYQWGENPDGSTFSYREQIKSHRCTKEELGLDKKTKNTTMFPVSDNFTNDLGVYYKRLYCPNKEDLVIFGDFNT